MHREEKEAKPVRIEVYKEPDQLVYDILPLITVYVFISLFLSGYTSIDPKDEGSRWHPLEGDGIFYSSLVSFPQFCY